MDAPLKKPIVAALLVLAMVAALNYLVQLRHTLSSDNDAGILNLAGRQRMLVTRVAHLSGQLAIHRNDPARQGDLRRLLLDAAAEMEREHETLIHAEPEYIADPEIWHIYFDAPARLDRQMHDYAAAARALARNPDGAGPGEPNFDLINRIAMPLVGLVDEGVKQYEMGAFQRIKSLRIFETVGLLILLAGLVVIWLTIFRPMARRIERDMRELAQGNAVLLRQKEALEKEKRVSENLRQQLGAILDAAGEGVTGVDLEGQIIFANAASSRLLGHPPEKLLGARHHELAHYHYPDGRPFPVEQCPIHQAFIKGLIYRSDNEVFWRADGTAMPVQVVTMPLYQQGVLAGAVLVFGDITERRAAAEAVQRTLQELERSNRELDDFAYIASHDLKEPLRGIHNYAGFLLEDYGTRLDEEGRRYLETLQRLARRMETLVDTLLHYSRLGREDLDKKDCDLNDILAEVTDSLGPMLREHNAAIRTRGSLPRLACNRVMVAELLHNLIVNGLKYNDRAEKIIEVGSIQGPDGTVCFVRDNGIGIAEKHRDAIFRIFKRLHGRNQYGGGTGAGLTIVKKIVERHGGRIWVESTPGEGSTFYFTLGKGRMDEQPVGQADSDR